MYNLLIRVQFLTVPSIIIELVYDDVKTTGLTETSLLICTPPLATKDVILVPAA